MDMLSTAFAKKITKDLKTKIEKVEKKVTEIEKRGDSFDERIDQFEQRDLNRNIVMSGVPSAKTNKE
jgi:chaperonin cofactor prefoldin